MLIVPLALVKRSALPGGVGKYLPPPLTYGGASHCNESSVAKPDTRTAREIARDQPSAGATLSSSWRERTVEIAVVADEERRPSVGREHL